MTSPPSSDLPDPQPTLGELRAGPVNVHVNCTGCRRPHWFKPEDFRGDDSVTLDELAARMRCTRCGRKDQLEVGVIPEQWVRYLRRTGQFDRLPEYAERWFPPGSPYGWP